MIPIPHCSTAKPHSTKEDVRDAFMKLERSFPEVTNSIRIVGIAPILTALQFKIFSRTTEEEFATLFKLSNFEDTVHLNWLHEFDYKLIQSAFELVDEIYQIDPYFTPPLPKHAFDIRYPNVGIFD